MPWLNDKELQAFYDINKRYQEAGVYEQNINGLPFGVHSGQAISYDLSQEQEFADLIAKYKNSPFYDELVNAAHKMFEYTPSALDQMSHWMVGRSDVNKLFEESRNAYRSELNSIIQKNDALKENDPVTQVQKDRLAGFNPDLAGTTTETGKVTDVDQPDSPLSERGGNFAVSEPIQQVTSAVFSAVQHAISIASFASDFSFKSLGALSGIPDLVGKVAPMFITPSMDEKGFNDLRTMFNGMSDRQLGRSVSKLIGARVSGNMSGAIGRQLRMKFNSSDFFQSVINSRTGEVQAGNAFGEAASNKFFNGVPTPSQFSSQLSGVVKALKPLRDLSMAAATGQLESAIAKNTHDKEYWNKRSGSAQALSENAKDQYDYEYTNALDGSTMAGLDVTSKELSNQNAAQDVKNKAKDWELKEQQRIINKVKEYMSDAVSKVVDNLSKLADSGDVLAEYTLLSLYSGESNGLAMLGLLSGTETGKMVRDWFKEFMDDVNGTGRSSGKGGRASRKMNPKHRRGVGGSR